MSVYKLAARLGLSHSQARLELKWLSQHALERKLSLDELVDRRLKKEPLQYILGTQPFGPLTLRVRPPVLIPRPETEDWVMRLSERIQTTFSDATSSTSPTLSTSSASHAELVNFHPSRSSATLNLLDLGTGSGCIPLLLSHLQTSPVRALGVDIADEALKLAEENAIALDLDDKHTAQNKNKAFMLLKASILDPGFASISALNPPYDVVTSNPPYIPFGEYLELDEAVRRWEDPRALFGGPGKGMEFYEAIVNIVRTKGFVRKGGIIALEVGHTQAQDVRALLDASGLFTTEVWRDPWDVERCVVGVAK